METNTSAGSAAIPTARDSDEIFELKRQLRDQEEAIAEIDRLLAETDYSRTSTKNVECGTKRKNSETPAYVPHPARSKDKKHASIDECPEGTTTLEKGETEKEEKHKQKKRRKNSLVSEQDHYGYQENHKGETAPTLSSSSKFVLLGTGLDAQKMPQNTEARC